MDTLINYEDTEKIQIINIGKFIYDKYKSFFKEKYNNNIDLNKEFEEIKYNNEIIEKNKFLLNEINILKEEHQVEKNNNNNYYENKIKDYQSQYNNLLNEKNKELKEERERLLKYQENQLNIYNCQLEKLNEEKKNIIENFNERIKEDVIKETKYLKDEIKELKNKNDYYYNLYVDKNKGKLYEEILYNSLTNINNNKLNNIYEINYIGSALSEKTDFQIYNKISKTIILLDTKNNITSKPVGKIDIDKFIHDVTLIENNAIGGILLANNKISGKSNYELIRNNDKIFIYVSNFSFDNVEFIFTLIEIIETLNSENNNNYNIEIIKNDYIDSYVFLKERINNLNNEKRKVNNQLNTLGQKYFSIYKQDIEIEISKNNKTTTNKENNNNNNEVLNFDELEKDRIVIGKRTKYYLQFEENNQKKIQYFSNNNPKNKKIKQLEKNNEKKNFDFSK